MGFGGTGSGGGGGLSEAEVQAIADVAQGAAEDAAAVYTDTVFAAAAAADIMAIPFKSAEFYLIGSHTGATTGQPSNRSVLMLPFRPAKSCTLAKVAVEQTTAGEAGSKIRLLVFDDVDGLPTNVLWQSSDIAGDGANGEKSEDPNLAVVPSELYYAGVQCHTATTTRPTLRYFQSTVAGARTRTSVVTSTGRQGFGYPMGNDGNVTNPLVAATITVGAGTMPCFWLQAD
jgi:hypothetical protein